MKILQNTKHKSILLPELKFKNVIKFDGDKNTDRMSYKYKIKTKNNDYNSNNNNSSKKKLFKENSQISLPCNKRSISINNIDNLEPKRINVLKEEIETLRYKLNEEKLKSEVLHEIAEEEKKKHILYRHKFQKLIKTNMEVEEIKKIDFISSKRKEDRVNKTKNNCCSNSMILVKKVNNYNAINNIKYINNNNHSRFLLTPKKENSENSNDKKVIGLTKKDSINTKLKINKINIINKEIINLKKKNIFKDKIIEE